MFHCIAKTILPGIVGQHWMLELHELVEGRDRSLGEKSANGGGEGAMWLVQGLDSLEVPLGVELTAGKGDGDVSILLVRLEVPGFMDAEAP